MFPDINSDNWGEVSEWVLVSGSSDFKTLGLLVVAEPSPAGALDSSGSRVYFAFKGVEAAEVLVDLLS